MPFRRAAQRATLARSELNVCCCRSLSCAASAASCYLPPLPPAAGARAARAFHEDPGVRHGAVDLGAREVEARVLGAEALVLTPVEFDLLASLSKAKGRIKSREALLDEARDRNYDVFDRSIDVHISSLRKKLHDDAKEPRFIRTVRSAGYMMVAPE